MNELKCSVLALVILIVACGSTTAQYLGCAHAEAGVMIAAEPTLFGSPAVSTVTIMKITTRNKLEVADILYFSGRATVRNSVARDAKRLLFHFAPARDSGGVRFTITVAPNGDYSVDVPLDATVTLDVGDSDHCRNLVPPAASRSEEFSVPSFTPATASRVVRRTD